MKISVITLIFSVLTGLVFFTYQGVKNIKSESVATNCKVINGYISNPEKRSTEFHLVVETTNKKVIDIYVNSVDYFKSLKEKNVTFMLSPRQLKTRTETEKRNEGICAVSCVLWVIFGVVCFSYAVSEY